MMKKELCERYIRVINDSRAKEEALGEALQALNADNFIIGLVPDEFTDLFNDMFITLVGESAYDWVTWWLYETDQESSKIWINGEEIDINSFDDLWEAAIKDA
jgi:hypothetical protein